MAVDYSELPSLELPTYPSEAASWAACDAIHDIMDAHPEDRAYVIAQYLDAFAKRQAVLHEQDEQPCR